MKHTAVTFLEWAFVMQVNFSLIVYSSGNTINLHLHQRNNLQHVVINFEHLLLSIYNTSQYVALILFTKVPILSFDLQCLLMIDFEF